MAKKRGRPKKTGPREPNGRLARTVIKDENAEPLALRARVFGLTEKDAKDQKAGSFIGRLRLKRQNDRNSPDGLDEEQYEAGLRYLELRNLYHKQIGAEEAIYESGVFSGMEASEEERSRRWASIRDRWHGAIAAVQAKQNESRGNLFAALDYCVVRDAMHVHMIGDLRLALNALADYFRRGKLRKAA